MRITLKPGGFVVVLFVIIALAAFLFLHYGKKVSTNQSSVAPSLTASAVPLPTPSASPSPLNIAQNPDMSQRDPNGPAGKLDTILERSW